MTRGFLGDQNNGGGDPDDADRTPSPNRNQTPAPEIRLRFVGGNWGDWWCALNSYQRAWLKEKASWEI